MGTGNSTAKSFPASQADCREGVFSTGGVFINNVSAGAWSTFLLAAEVQSLAHVGPNVRASVKERESLKMRLEHCLWADK